MNEKERYFEVRDADGSVMRFDEYEHIVIDSNGRKFEYKEYDPANQFQRDLTTDNVHVASALTNFAVDYGSQSGMAIADFVARPILVTKASDYYYTSSANNTFRRVDTSLASDNAPLNEVSPNLSTTLYKVKPYGMSTFVPLGVEANADSVVRPRMRAMRRILDVMTLDREHRCVAEALDGTTNFASYKTTLTTSNYWDDGASSDPRKDIMTAEESALLPINAMACSRKTWNRFKHNEQVAKYGLPVGMGANESPAGVMSRLGFDYIMPFISDMRSESTTAGTTTKSYVWDDDCLFFHLPSGNEIEDAPTLRTFRWLKDGMSRESGGFRIREWRDESRGQDGGVKLAVVVNEDIVCTAADSGYLFENCW